MKKHEQKAGNAGPNGGKNKPDGKELDTPQARAVLERLNRLESQAAALLAQAESMDDVSAFRRAVELLEQAVAAAPVESARHGMAVINLCSGLGSLYQQTGEVAALQQGSSVAQHWLTAIPPGDWRHALYMLAGGVLLYHKALTTRQESDEDAAIEVLEMTRASVRPGAGVDCTASTLLAELRLTRYQRTWDLKDLAACLDHVAHVLDAPRARIEERRTCCKLLAHAMVQRYQALGSVSDLDAAIQVAERSLNEDLRHEKKAEFYAVLATALRYRFNELANRADLDRALESYQRAIQEEVDETVRAVIMDNYANGLANRYRITDNLTDLHDAIASSHAALDLLPEGSPHQARVLANLGTSLLERCAATRDSANLSEAVRFLRRGLEHTTSDLDGLQRLHAVLARSLLYLAAASAAPGALIRDGLEHFAKAREITDALSEHLVFAGLLAHEKTLWVADMEVGALFWLAELDPARAPELLRRALEVGEAEKSRSLAADLGRRSLPRPAGVPEELFEQERWWLGALTALDNSEISGVPWAHQVRNMGRRDDIQRELNSIWAEMAGASPAGARYVQMRRSPDRAWLDSVPQLDRTTATLSLLPIRDVRTGGVSKAQGLAVLGWVPDRAEPFVIAKNLLRDPVPWAARQFEAEVPGDGGLGLRLETWHRPLEALLGSKTPDLLKPARTIVVSPPRDGHNLPWNLVLQRVGWRAEDGNPLPVVTVPTLAILAPGSAPKRAGAGKPEKPLPKRMRYVEPRTVDEALKQVLRLAGGWSGPLVAGNPTNDLPAAEGEARAVAAALGIKPLLGPEVATETVLGALYDAPLIHLAAHAWFDEKDPLESEILVADGTISARELVGSFCEAELVVLSSCEGGTASRVIGGEVAGLGHALLRAGARAVLASLWPVDDEATAFLMAEFYRARQPGVGEAAALAQAMRTTSERPPWRHPYFWSGFVLMQGEL